MESVVARFYSLPAQLEPYDRVQWACVWLHQALALFLQSTGEAFRQWSFRNEHWGLLAVILAGIVRLLFIWYVAPWVWFVLGLVRMGSELLDIRINSSRQKQAQAFFAPLVIKKTS